MCGPLNRIHGVIGILCYNFLGRRGTQKKANAKNGYNAIGILQPGNGISSLRP